MYVLSKLLAKGTALLRKKKHFKNWLRKVWIGTVILCILLEVKCTGDLQQDKACSAIKAIGYTSSGSPAITQLHGMIKAIQIFALRNNNSNMADQERYYRLSGIG